MAVRVARQRHQQDLGWQDRRALLHNQRRLRELRHHHGSDLELFCSHDVLEFERLSGRSARLPPEAMRWGGAHRA